MKWSRRVRMAVAGGLIVVGAVTCLGVGARSPYQPEYQYSGGACQYARCGDDMDMAAWTVAWMPWTIGYLAFLMGQILLVMTRPSPRHRPTTRALSTLRPVVTASLVLVVAVTWRWSVEIVAAAFGGYHTGVFASLASSLPLWWLLFRLVPGQASPLVRLVTLAAAYVPGVLRVWPLMAVVLPHPEAQPVAGFSFAPQLWGALAAFAAYLFGAAVERALRPAAPTNADGDAVLTDAAG